MRLCENGDRKIVIQHGASESKKSYAVFYGICGGNVVFFFQHCYIFVFILKNKNTERKIKGPNNISTFFFFYCI